MNSGYLYGLTTDGEVIIFVFKVTGTSNDHSKCSMLARIQIPQEFREGSTMGFASVRGALILQSASGKLLVLDATDESLL